MGDEPKAPPKCHLALAKGALVVQGPVNARMYDTIATLPGKRRRVDGILYIQATEENLNHILGRHPDIEMESKIRALLDNFQEQNKKNQAEAEKQRKEAKLETENFPFKSTPYTHQLNDFVRYAREKLIALFYEMGAGKTKVTLDLAAYKYSIGEIDTLIVIAPNGVHRQWVTEQLAEHLPDFTNYKAFFLQSGKRRSGRDNFEEVYDYEEGLRVFTFNVECFASQTGQKALLRIMSSSNKVMMIIDESTKIKNHKAKRTQFILKTGEKAVVRGILNGTPVTQGVQDLFSQMLFLDDKILGSQNYYVFQHKYLVMGGYENRSVVGYRNLEEIQTRVDKVASRILKEDCLDLPEKIFVDREIDMSEEQWRVYDEIREDFITTLKDGTELTVAEAMARVIKLQQVLCGHVKTPDGTKRIGDSRAKEVVEIMSEAPGKMIIWHRFIEDAEMIKEALADAGIKFAHYTGSSDERAEAIQKFRDEEDCRAFIANPQSASTGLNLTVATCAIWYSPSFSLSDYLQANDRCHRIGQHYPVTYIHLKVPKTIDGKVLSALRRKQELAHTVIDLRDLML